MTQTALVTADDLFSMDEDDRYELVEGVLVPAGPPSGFEHGETVATIAFLVSRCVRERRLGRMTGAGTGYRLRRNPDIVRAPDFAFVARGRVTPEMDRTRYLDLAPDLVVEVVSPSDSAADVNTKVLAYLDAGVRLVWVVYPRSQTVAVHRPGRAWELLRADDELSGEDVLPDFVCPLADIFADPEANPEPGGTS